LALQTVIIRQQGPQSPLRQAIGTDIKGKISPGLYLAGTFSALAFERSGYTGVDIAIACFGGAAIMWIVPDRRIARMVRYEEAPDSKPGAPDPSGCTFDPFIWASPLNPDPSRR
jgi:hypothetical protein